ncbi:MAG: hypothetical protein AAF456_00735, partial [Planctomycetota bacterium]
ARASDSWTVLFDSAPAESGKLPADLAGSDLVEKLPVLFRTIRSKKLSPDQLDELIEQIKET